MTRTDKRLLARTISLGLTLTMLVIAADGFGLLDQLERYFYDFRARHFQNFTPKPTDKIIHLDIDDNALRPESLGRFPWARTKLAEIVDELHLAGAKVIGFDVIFPEPEDVRYEKQKDGTFKEIDDDQNFADAIKRSGNVVIPFDAHLKDSTAASAPTTAPSKEVQRLLEFSVPLQSNLPRLLQADQELATIEPFSQAAKYSGVVNFLPSPDSVIRSVPLFINYRGMLMPHMALVAACAMLDVPISDVKIGPDSVTIPVHNADPITIPVRIFKSNVYGNVGMFMDVPWFGKGGSNNWETMYDFPKYQQPKQQITLSNVWAICQDLHFIERNNLQADDDIANINTAFHDKDAAKFLETKPSDRSAAVRAKIVASLIQQLNDMGYDDLAASKPSDMKPDVEETVKAYIALRRVNEANSSLSRKIGEARQDLQKKLEGRYVLIGWTATGQTDYYATSIEPQCPGVMMQGVMFNAIMNRDFWTTAPWWLGAILTFVLGALTTLAVAFLSVYGALFCTALIVGAYALLNGVVLFDYGNYVVAAAAPVTASVLIWFGVSVGRILYEQRERGRITKRFSRMVDPALVNHFIENPDALFDGQMKEMTVVFTDLAGFTTISEKLRERTVPLLNEYMSLMLPIIRENRGYWNKFLGDGIMFFYNAPLDNANHARDAVHTVLEMQKVMVPFNQRLLEAQLPKVTMRAGLSTGMMVVGDAGSTDTKHFASDYTVLGDEVNLGARLESANKAVGSRVLLSGRTAELVGSEFLLRPIGALQVVGKTEGIMTYEALCAIREATDSQKNLVEFSSQIVELFRTARFDPCIQAAKKLEEAFGSSKFTQLYIRLSRRYLMEPPGEGFDGQIVLEEK